MDGLGGPEDDFDTEGADAWPWWQGNALLDVLLVEDSPSDAVFIEVMLEGWADARRVSRLEQASALFEEASFDVILLDLNLPDSAGLDTVHAIRERAPDAALVVLTGEQGKLALDGLAAGADDFLLKEELTTDGLRRTLAYAVERAALRRALAEQERERLREGERLIALGQLAAYVAHEVNNPASFVLANLEEVAERMAESAESDDRALVEEALGGVRRIVKITRDLHRYARFENEPARRLRLDEVARSALGLLSSRIRSSDVEVEEALSAVPEIVGVEGRLVQAAVNFLANALDATPDGWIRVATRLEGVEVVLVVEDDGPGMSPEQRANALQPFYSTKRGEGLGLGLAVCAEVARQHNGRLRLDQGERGGLRVELWLPGATGLVESARPPATRKRDERPRVLIIDDQLQVASAYQRMLRKHMDVAVVGSGHEALEWLATRSDLDLILCDVQMPSMSGPAVRDAIDERHPELTGRVAFCTGGTWGVDEVTLGSTPTLAKPFDVEAVWRLLEELDATPRT